MKVDIQDSSQMNRTIINLQEWQPYDQLQCK